MDTLLVVSEKYFLWPGDWKAESQGKELDILRVNGFISGVFVPEGATDVVFTYSPKSYRRGRAITGIACLIIFLYLIFLGFKRFSK